MAYLMESASEGTRLKAKTDRQSVDEELSLAGLRTGMRALDAGCASGAVSVAMADQVGPSGRVVGLELSRERVREAKRDGESRSHLKFTQGSIDRLPFANGSFDFSLCRLVLEYIKNPQPFVDELVRVTKPGGRVALIDVDGYGAFHHPLEGPRKAAIDVVQKLLAGAGFDAYIGRKLFSLLRRAGLSDIDVHVRPYHLIAGAATEAQLSNWRYKLDTLGPSARKAIGPAWDEHAAAMIDHLKDPDTLTYSSLFVVSGVRA